MASADAEDTTGFSCYLKWIDWNSGKIPIIMQSRNGPCPLIATLNVLLLREKVKLPSMLEQITADQLLTYLGECIMDFLPTQTTAATATTTTTAASHDPDKTLASMEQEMPTSTTTTTAQSIVELQEQLQSLHTTDETPVSPEGAIMNLEQHIHDAMEILPKLKTGLDVNMRFTGITDFEYTPECIIFDLLRIPLYHGWIIDPSLTELQLAIGKQSYNQLMDSLVVNKNSQQQQQEESGALAMKMVMIESFLEQTASQLTHYGLEELRTKIRDNELGILFRNNHFLTLFKRDGQLYTLVTDHGYLTEHTVVWEILDSVEGAGGFFDSNFLESKLSSNAKALEQKIIADEKQVMDDMILALMLEEEEQQAAAGRRNSNQEAPSQATTSTHDQDLELAKKLQAEWDSQYAQSLWPATTTTTTTESPNQPPAEHLQPNRVASESPMSIWQQEAPDAARLLVANDAPANELHHELSSATSTNEPFVVGAASQLVVVTSPSAGSQEAAGQRAVALADQSAGSPSTISPAATSTSTCTATVGGGAANHSIAASSTTTTTTRPSTTSQRGLRNSNSETKNSKDSNCSVS